MYIHTYTYIYIYIYIYIIHIYIYISILELYAYISINVITKSCHISGQPRNIISVSFKNELRQLQKLVPLTLFKMGLFPGYSWMAGGRGCKMAPPP